jgi:aryl-alcohol dehydrogenase-like predicted oxidoreductase
MCKDIVRTVEPIYSRRAPAMKLTTMKLGRSGIEITRVGLGAWAIGGGGWLFGWGPQDDAASMDAIRHAIGLGINWIDTAAIYGLGHSEEVIGRALAEIPARERPMIFTKCGLIGDPERPFEMMRRDLRPESIRRECEQSLRRLGVERIDLYQFHWPENGPTAVEDSWGEMARLIDEGKVRAGGVSNFNVQLLDRCERIRHVDSLQPPFSLIRRKAAADVIPWCAANETGVIVYSPMQAGLLTETFTRERVAAMADDDWRRQSDDFKEPALSRNLALRDALRPIAARHGVSVAAVAVAWTLAWPGVTGAIVGGRSPRQIDDWAGAGGLALSSQELDDIAVALRQTGAGSEPSGPIDVYRGTD